MGSAGSFTENVEAIYRRHKKHILPFVGSCFERPDQVSLRILTVGINAYVGQADWARVEPWWYRKGFQCEQERHNQVVLREARLLGKAVSGQSSLFGGRFLYDRDSFYHTNAIKVYLPEHEGKRAAQLTPEHFEKYRKEWRDELAAMSAHRALPHVIVIFGDPFWEIAWTTVCRAHPQRHPELALTAYESANGEARHHLNRIALDTDDGPHPMLLVKLAHPAARGRSRSARWLITNSEFRRLAGALS